MHPARFFRSLVFPVFLALTLLAASRAAEESTTIKFSDPARPGTLRINVTAGELRLQGADVNEVTVSSDARASNRATRRSDGLRVLTDSSSYTLGEKDNVVTLDAMDHISHGTEFRITVPRNTAILVRTSFGGEIVCSGISGDLEIHSVNGEVTLNDVTGGAVVENMNGEIHANIRELAPNKPLSFTSMNGEIVLRVAADAKANIRLRTQNGSVLTDFDESALVTRTESAPRSTRNRSGRVLPPEAADAIREAARMAAQAGREAAQAAREGLEAARQGAEEARAQAEHSRSATRNGVTGDSVPPVPPVPPIPPVAPTISGGKLITGTLNGGGPEINVATLNGDVTLRKLETKAASGK